MTAPALRWPEDHRTPPVHLTVITGGKDRISIPIVSALTLAALQILDGLFTVLGVQQFGPSVEGNALVRTLISEFGVLPAVCTVKCAALIIIALLLLLAPKVRWLRPAMNALCVVYLLAAVVPWTFLLWGGHLL